MKDTSHSLLLGSQLLLVVFALVLIELADGVVGSVAVRTLVLLDAAVALEVDLVAVAGGVTLTTQLTRVRHLLGVNNLERESLDDSGC